jgi:hypothetical protein
MKLLDPFGGLKIAKGHSLFHFALWIASFTIEGQIKNTPNLVEGHYDELAERIIKAFHILRATHFLVCVLSIPHVLGRSQIMKD